MKSVPPSRFASRRDRNNHRAGACRPVRNRSTRARYRIRTSAAARLSPLRRWAARCARRRPPGTIRPNRSGSITKLRKGAMLFSMDGPRDTAAATSTGKRSRNSSQKRLSGHASHRFLQTALNVVSAARQRTHAAHGEPARMIRQLNQLVRRRRHVGEGCRAIRR